MCCHRYRLLSVIEAKCSISRDINFSSYHPSLIKTFLKLAYKPMGRWEQAGLDADICVNGSRIFFKNSSAEGYRVEAHTVWHETLLGSLLFS